MGVLAGADGPTGISRWAVAKKHLLLQALDLPHGIPSRDVIRRVLPTVKVDAFQTCFVCAGLGDPGFQNADRRRSIDAVFNDTFDAGVCSE